MVKNGLLKKAALPPKRVRCHWPHGTETPPKCRHICHWPDSSPPHRSDTRATFLGGLELSFVANFAFAGPAQIRTPQQSADQPVLTPNPCPQPGAFGGFRALGELSIMSTFFTIALAFWGLFFLLEPRFFPATRV